jgi:hypothetical protein
MGIGSKCHWESGHTLGGPLSLDSRWTSCAEQRNTTIKAISMPNLSMSLQNGVGALKRASSAHADRFRGLVEGGGGAAKRVR